MRTLAALLLAFPLSTLAQAGSAGSAPSEPQWSLGAGVTFDTAFARTYPVFASTQFASAAVPGVATSLERRLAPSTWLVAGATLAWRDTEQDLGATASGVSRWRAGDAHLAGGIRQVLTGPGAPVEVSVLALADVGVAWAEARVVLAGVPDDQRADGWAAGASLGLALERELTSRLSLRVASPLLQASYLSTSQRSGGVTAPGHDFVAGFALSPRLELRLAF